MPIGRNLIIDTNNLSDIATIDNEVPESINEGEVLFRVDKFALTSNNITYGFVGHMVGYWQFFPGVGDKGIIPVWGFADVIASNLKSIKVGARYYGYYPMGSHLLMRPEKVTPYGFMDGVKHRRELPPIYNFYTSIDSDAVYTPESEDLQCILRPLFTTSFLLDDFFFENKNFDSKQLILTSASSKTALGLAHLLHKRKKTGSIDIDIVGLTSSHNKAFVEASGYYDKVLSYDNVSQIDFEAPGSIVEFAGNHALQYELQTKFGDRLMHNCLVGVVDWQNARGEKRLPKKGDFFFAPSYAQKRQKDWGREGFQSRLQESWLSFTDAAKNWMTIEQHQGLENLSKTYLDMLQGNINPKIGYIYSV